MKSSENMVVNSEGVEQKMIYMHGFEYIDEENMIRKFKELINPSNEKQYKNPIYNKEFLEISSYLGSSGYQMNQFPNFFAHLTSLQSFAYDQIRSRIHSRRNKLGSVSWDERRNLIFELEISKIKNLLYLFQMI